MDYLQLAINWAKWLLEDNKKHTGHVHYSEGSNRMSAIGQWPIKFPVTTDCSGFVTLVLWLAGVSDPNGLHYNHEGYTGTLLSHEAHVAHFVKNLSGVAVENVRVGDLVVYGPGTGDHVALIIEVSGPDILTISHGQEGDPSYVWVNKPVGPARGHGTDGRQPQTFLRPVYASDHPFHAIPDSPSVVASVIPSVVTSISTDTASHSASVQSATPPEPPKGPLKAANPVQTPTPQPAKNTAKKGLKRVVSVPKRLVKHVLRKRGAK